MARLPDCEPPPDRRGVLLRTFTFKEIPLGRTGPNMGVSLTVRSSLMPEVWRGMESGVEGGGVALSEGVSGATDEVEVYCGPAEVLGGLLVGAEVGMGVVLMSGLGSAADTPEEGVTVDWGVDSGRGTGDGSVV